MKDGTGTGILSQLRFGMWLVAFIYKVDHSVIHKIMTRWLTHLIGFFDEFRR